MRKFWDRRFRSRRPRDGRSDWASYLALAVLTVVCVLAFTGGNGVFGSKVDWISQHSVLPDYFRQQFYETGDFFPEFSLNIGGGQNIYNFAYYGLYSPVILPSYLLPFVRMSDYMQTAQAVCLAASVLLLYGWLRSRDFSKKIAFGTAIIFLLAGPMIFHSYNQIMFVDYMPFLCMGFFGADRHFDRGKSGLLTVSVFLMIMTSFYFSIGGMLALTLYGVHRYSELYGERYSGDRTWRKRIGRFFAEGVRFIFPMLTAVLMSSVLLVPAAMALIGREGKIGHIRFGELLIPRISANHFFYNPYGIGLTTLTVTALAVLMFSGSAGDSGKAGDRAKRSARMLAWSCTIVLTVPVFGYLLNGGLYIRDKVMIPFLPLLCYVTAYYLRVLENDACCKNLALVGNSVGRRQLLQRILPYFVPLIVACMGWKSGNTGGYGKLLLVDAVVMLGCACVFYFAGNGVFGRRGRSGNSILFLVPTIVFLAVSGRVTNVGSDYAVDREFYEEITDGSIDKLIGEVTAKENGFYRTEQMGTATENAANLNRTHAMGQYVSSMYSSSYNADYMRFRKDVFGTEEPFRNFLMQSVIHNPVYQRFMGVKYIISREGIPGYEALPDKKTESGYQVYVNGHVSPMAYTTDRIMSEDAYKKLEFPYNQLALLRYAVAEEGGEADGKTAVAAIKKDFNVAAADVTLPKMIDAGSDESMEITLPGNSKGSVLFLQFDVKNKKPSEDVSVWVEGVRNKLTCESHFYYNGNTTFTYAVPLKENQKKITVTFGKGKYEIGNVKCYAGTPDAKEREALYQSAFQMDKKGTKGNVVAGKIHVGRAGYFVTTIPYDRNFEIRVNGKGVESERVNTAFLGFQIGEGEKDIAIIYHAPGVHAGKWMSVAGVLLFFLLLFSPLTRARCHTLQ